MVGWAAGAAGRMGDGRGMEDAVSFLGAVYDFDAFGGWAGCNFAVDGMGICVWWGWWVSADGA